MGYCQWQPDSSSHVNSESSEQSGAVPVQSELQSQPGCPMQLEEPVNSEQDQADPVHFWLEDDQKQPWMALHVKTPIWP